MTQQITKSNKQQPRLSALAELFREGGVAIRYEQGKEKDTQICLTDMWKANGADRSKKPYDWLRSLDGSEYIQAFLEESKRSELLTISQTRSHGGFGKCVAIPTLESRSASVEEAPLQIAKSIGVIATIKGRYGGTFAHQMIALEYARYLDKRFAVRMNRKLEEKLEEERDAVEFDERLQERFETEVRGLYLHDRAIPWEQLFSPMLLKRFAILKGHPEWYKVDGTKMCVALSRVLDEVFYDKLPDIVVRLAREMNPKYPSGGRRFKMHQILKGEAKQKWLELVADANRYAFQYDTYTEFKKVWDHVHKNPDEKPSPQIEMFRAVLSLVPAQMEA